jgi:hypothetical protein
VMIHVENASIAGRAVMAPLWLEDVAHKAVPAPLILCIAQMEAPKDRHLAGVCGHWLEEGP